MLGTYSVEGEALVFHPRFPLAPDTNYHGKYPGGDFVFEAPAPRAPVARVEHVYPSANVLPANTLRLYIYFSVPMSVGEAWQHIHLLDGNGNALAGSFLELEEELWDPDHKRLTVLFDPGRVKRGLVLSTQAGSPIVEGRHYTLAIDGGWHDARGVPLVEGVRKQFTGGRAERTPADPKKWRLEPPAAGSLEPLVVGFPRAMDYALLERTLDVPGMRGAIAIDKDEREWRFTPETPWKAGRYELRVSSTLEDICGNHPDRAFDVDLRRETGQRVRKEFLSLPFRVHSVPGASRNAP
jgi:hypothetical protein